MVLVETRENLGGGGEGLINDETEGFSECTHLERVILKRPLGPNLA